MSALELAIKHWEQNADIRVYLELLRQRREAEQTK